MNNIGCPNHGLEINKDCFLCWKFFNDPDYNKLWGGPGVIDELNRWTMPEIRGPAISLRHQLLNFTQATIGHALNGLKNVGEEELNRRKSICSTCPEHENGRCKKCGCFTNLKASWESEKCPLGKWEEIK